MGKTTDIYIVRHGQTSLNKSALLQGRSDYPLTEEGEDQAIAAGKWLSAQNIVFDTVYTSPLIRAVRTAELMTGICCQEPACVQTYTDQRLIEMDYGPYEGIDLTSPPPEIREFFSDFVNNPAPKGMEQLSDVVRRAGVFLEEIKRNEKPEGQTILISTHAIAMKGLLEYLTPGSGGSYWSKYIGNCSLYKTRLQGGSYSIPVEIR